MGLASSCEFAALCTDHCSTCDKMVVYKMPGWETSYGIQWEIKKATELGIPIEYHDF